jgi:hypothetical protein
VASVDGEFIRTMPHLLRRGEDAPLLRGKVESAEVITRVL